MGEAARRMLRKQPPQVRFEMGVELAQAAMRHVVRDVDIEGLSEEEAARKVFHAIRRRSE